MKITKVLSAVCVAGLLVPASQAAAAGMKEGALTLKSAGPIAFGPDGILLVADTKSAAIVAIQTSDTAAKGGDGVGNGKTLKVGDSIDGAKLVSIERTSAEIELNGAKQKLTMH